MYVTVGESCYACQQRLFSYMLYSVNGEVLKAKALTSPLSSSENLTLEGDFEADTPKSWCRLESKMLST